MYSYLSGVLTEKFPTSVKIDVNGIGFQLIVPLSTSQKLNAGEKTKLLVHHVVREDAEFLFGFSTEEEKNLFKLLLSVSGIGPKMVITVLSGLGINELKSAIVEGSVPALTAISGIGKKTAERMIIELREKVVIESRGEMKSGASSKEEALVQDSLRALVSLGYSKQSAKTAIDQVLKTKISDKWTPESLIRETLKQIQFV